MREDGVIRLLRRVDRKKSRRGLGWGGGHKTIFAVREIVKRQ